MSLVLGKYFKQDIITPNQTLKPIIVITTPLKNYAGSPSPDILFVLTQDNEQLYDTSGNLLTTINCISKVSNVKVSNNYDSKRLKINRLRCSLYNYYDLSTKITNHINSSIIGNQMYLFYKSPTTNIIGLYSYVQSIVEDYACALVFIGEINRIDFNNDIINISSEDRTQVKIASKTVPYMSIDKLPIEIQNNITPEYKEDDAVVPMTFGAVDKAPVLPYISPDDIRVMNVLVDMFPTHSHYKTARIPSLLHSGTVHPQNNDYYLYVKEGDDYIILDHFILTAPYQNQLYSHFKLHSMGSYGNEYLFPELHTEEEGVLFESWDMKGFAQRQVVNAIASEGTISNISSLELNDISAEGFTNEEGIYNNSGYPKVWYRLGDNLYPHTNNYFETDVANWNNSYSSGAGRWIVLKLEEGVGNPLLNMYLDGNWAGNTFLAGDWKLRQTANASSNTPNSSTIPNTATRTGFFVAPLASEIWDLMNQVSGTWTSVNEKQALLALTLCRTRANLDVAQNAVESGNVGNLSIQNLDEDDPYETAPIYCLKDENERSDNKYWGNFGSNIATDPVWRNINGYIYGEKGNNVNIETEGADSHNAIAIYEYYPPTWRNNLNSYRQKLIMNNIGFIQSVKVEDITKQSLYASIIGRKSHLYTEWHGGDVYETYYDDVESEPAPLEHYILGPDGQLPDFDALIEQIYLTNIYTYVATVPYATNLDENLQLTDASLPITYNNYDSIDSFLETEMWDTVLSSRFQDIVALDDSPILTNYSFFKKFIFKALLSPCTVSRAMYSGNSNIRDHIVHVGHGMSPETLFNHLTNVAPKTWGNIDTFLNQGDFAKTFIREILKYVYQTDISFPNMENQWEVISQRSTPNDVYHSTYTSSTLGDFQPGMDYGLVVDYVGIIQPSSQFINMTSTINNARQYSWNTLPNEINTFDDWVDNFYVYMDDLIQAVNHGVCLNFQASQNQAWYFTGVSYVDYYADYYAITPTNINLNNYAGSNPWITGFALVDEDFSQLETTTDDIATLASLSYTFDLDIGFDTDGIIQKPTDIVMNILTNEMEFGNYHNEDVIGQNIMTPRVASYDPISINISRDAHSDWKMGFSVDKKMNGKSLIEEILKESKSYPRFTSAGQFSFMTIRDSYNWNDVDKVILVEDILKYKFTETKREDVVTSAKMFYRYDYGQKRFSNYIQKDISNYLPDYMETGFENYNLDIVDGHKDINLKYHSDLDTVNDFMRYTLLNRCNTHNIVSLTLPLSYMNLIVSNIIYIPLINNEKIFDIDYSDIAFKNTQPIYPFWIILETDIGVDKVKIKAYQLHYLGTDGQHGFDVGQVVGNTEEFSEYNFTNGQPIPNWNWNPDATVDSGVRIPYFDLNKDGIINAPDITMVAYIAQTGGALSEEQREIMKYNADGSINTNVGSWDNYLETQEIIIYNY